MQVLTASQASPEVPINENFETLQHQQAYGKKHPTTTGLTWGYYGGRWGGFSVSDGTLALTGSTTNYVVVLRSSGAISVSTATTNWNSSLYARVYKITTSSSAVTAVEDHRAGPNGVHGFSSSTLSLDDLDDVDTASSPAPADGDVLTWDTSVSPPVARFAAPTGGGTELRGVTFTSDTASTADSDPGAGKLRWNSATQASATVLYLDNSSADSVSLTTFWGSLAAAGLLYLQQADDSTRWQLWKWSSATDGTGYRKLAVTLQAASASGIADAKAVLTQFCEAGAGGGGSSQGKHGIQVLAGAMQPSLTAGCAPLAFRNAGSGQPDYATLDFSTTTEEYAQFALPMPKKWDEGTVTAKFYWTAPTGSSGGVVWSLQAVAISDDDPLAASFGTAQVIADTFIAANDLHVSSETPAITIAGTPQAEDMVFFRVARSVANGSDTLGVDARLIAVVVYITTNADTDA